MVVMLILPQIWANRISVDQIKTVANNFYFERNNISQQLDYSQNFIADMFALNIESEEVIYIVNFERGGWVAVSASDAVIPIIAYSFEGYCSQQNVPDNFSSWISQYEKQIYWAITQDYKPTTKSQKLWSHYLSGDPEAFSIYGITDYVEPLITSSWDQGLYYNEMCPADPGGPGGHCFVGCVPTTMGQLCNYFRFPQTGTGSYSYECPPYGELSADFGNSNYDWNQMPSNVSTNSLATAQILYHLGVSCDLVYGPDGSGMYNHKAAYALRTHFKYSPETQYVYRDSTSLNWDSLLVSHLDRKMPMYYAGWSVPNIYGHAFVCDGYQESSYFHFNWGWSGSYDGYFYTDNLTPGGSNFNLAQEVIINCFPDTVNYQYPSYCQGADTVNSVSGTIDDGSGPIYNYQNNLNCSWLISPADSVNFIILEFLKFDTPENDTLFIYDGNSDNAQLLGAYSGISVPTSLTSSGDEVFIKFKTDNENTAGGWLIGYSSDIPLYCSNSMLTEPVGTISDGSGPANYHNLTTCLWMIQPGSGLDIILSFSEFSTEEDFDYVSVFDGTDKIGEFSGNELPPTLTATSGIMTVVFATNSSITESGWEAHYTTSPVGTNEIIKKDQVLVFPNPATNILNIEFADISATFQIILYDVYGKKVMKSQGINSKSMKLQTNEIPDGIYIIEIINNNQKVIEKVIIRH